MSSKYGKLRPLMLVAILGLSVFSTGVIAFAVYQATLGVSMNLIPSPTEGLAFFDANNATLTSINFGDITVGNSRTYHVFVKNTGNVDRAYVLTNPYLITDVRIAWDYQNFIINHGETFDTILTAYVNATATPRLETGKSLIFSPSG
jgi:hypothetical protein